MLHLFEDWTSIAQRLRAAPAIALFLDFDGTLARLQPRPEDVSMDGAVHLALVRLARSRRFRIWIISGRRQADVRGRVRVAGIQYLGLHGWEGRTGTASLAQETECSLASALACLRSRLEEIPAIWIEDKQYAFTIHYRGAAETDVLRARAIVDNVITPFSACLRLQHGKCVWEILPRELEDKGAAVRHELASLSPRALPIYVGDDQVDEPAFTALPDGLTVRVGRSAGSHARYRLSGVPQVRAFLDKLRSEFTPSVY